MPKMELKEAIEVLKQYLLSIEHRFNKGVYTQEHIESIQFAISKLSLLEQVEKGMPQKRKCYIVNTYEDLPHPGIIPLNCHKCFNCGFNSAIDLCNAHLVKKLEGIEEVIIETESMSDTREWAYDISKVKEIRERNLKRIKEVAQAITTHLMGGKE